MEGVNLNWHLLPSPPRFSSATALDTLWCLPIQEVLQVERAIGETPYTEGKGRQKALPITDLPCSPQCSLAAQLRIGQTTAKVQENLLFTSGLGHRASLWLWEFEGDAWSCSVPLLNQVLALSLWAAKLSHACLFGCFFLKWQAARLQSKALSINSIFLERSSRNSICLHSLPCRDVKGVSRRWKHSAPGPLLFFVPFLGSRWYGWSKSRHYLLGIPPKGVCNVLAVVRPMNTCIGESGIYVVPKEAWALAWPVAPQTWWILRYVLKSD